MSVLPQWTVSSNQSFNHWLTYVLQSGRSLVLSSTAGGMEKAGILQTGVLFCLCEWKLQQTKTKSLLQQHNSGGSHLEFLTILSNGCHGPQTMRQGPTWLGMRKGSKASWGGGRTMEPFSTHPVLTWPLNVPAIPGEKGKPLIASN